VRYAALRTHTLPRGSARPLIDFLPVVINFYSSPSVCALDPLTRTLSHSLSLSLSRFALSSLFFFFLLVCVMLFLLTLSIIFSLCLSLFGCTRLIDIVSQPSARARLCVCVRACSSGCGGGDSKAKTFSLLCIRCVHRSHAVTPPPPSFAREPLVG
jgi:hypothetical protein